MVSLPAWAFRVPIGWHFGGFFAWTRGRRMAVLATPAAAVGGRLGGGGGPAGPVAQGVGELAIGLDGGRQGGSASPWQGRKTGFRGGATAPGQKRTRLTQNRRALAGVTRGSGGPVKCDHGGGGTHRRRNSEPTLPPFPRGSARDNCCSTQNDSRQGGVNFGLASRCGRGVRLKFLGNSQEFSGGTGGI